MQNTVPTRLVACTLALLLLFAPVALAAAASDSSAKGGPTKPIELNSATLDDLVEIPGIGPTMAQRILDWRDEHGPFGSVDDLMKVKGIGEKSLAKLRRFVVVSKAKSR
jgi:competence protein ComEA